MDHRRRRSFAPLILAGLVVTSCAQFAEPSAQGFEANPPLEAGPEPTPQIPEAPQSPSPPPGAPDPSPDPPDTTAPDDECADEDPAVVATCLDPIGGITVLPDGESAVVGERRTGRLLEVAPETEPKVLDTVGVDTAGGGGLLDVALSPAWAEDQLLYLYITTKEDNRVVRLATGDSPKPVLTGIPRGKTGNAGSIAFDASGNLLVATGAAGDPTAAADPASLAGKLLRVDLRGRPVADNPDPRSAVLASGLDAPGGVCTDADTGTSWVTDRTPSADRLRAVDPVRGLGPVAWSWPDTPGAAGCAAIGGRVAVAQISGEALYVLTTSPEGTVVADPEILAKNEYGRLNGADVSADGLVWVGTVNKDGGEPVATDDRVVQIQPESGAGGSGPD